MASVTEVLHAFPANTMIGAEHHQHHHRDSQQSASSRRSTLSRTPRGDASLSTATTATTTPTAHGQDTTMADVMAPTSRPSSITRNTFHHGPRELAYHNTQAGAKDKASQTLKSSASVHQSPVTAHSHSHAQSVSSRGVDSSSIESSIHTSPEPSEPSQSPRSNPSPPSPPRIKVKSLSHIQSFVIDDANPLAFSRASSRLSLLAGRDTFPQYEISEMPVAEIIEMVAGLLTKITNTNDRQQEFLNSNQMQTDGDGAGVQTSSVMAFHGKNIPSISILSYLSRIHKYCPTTYEVFLSLLVYFDRMTERVNAAPYKSFRQANQESLERHLARLQETGQTGPTTASALDEQPTPSQHMSTPPSSGSLGTSQSAAAPAPSAMPPSPESQSTPTNQDASNMSQFFVVDSFNIHRLVIAGVTCASKFFSDIFYTNSRYAKVGGLPLNELNNLELQFLLLNDFRLAVPLEEMEAYGTMLVEFYAREVLAQQYPSRG